MISRRRAKSLQKAILAPIVGVLFYIGASPVITAATLSELIEKAKQEKALSATAISSITGKLTGPLAEAFKRRFGLDIDVTITPIENPQSFPKAIAETKAGMVPTFDAIDGADTDHVTLLGLGGIQKIDNWERLLAEVNPTVRSGKVKPEYLSPRPLNGFGFAYLSWEKALLYNPRLITAQNLPTTHAELAEARYKGMWTQPPWTTHWDPGPFVFPNLGKEKWLDIVRRAGKNAGAVQAELVGLQRLLVGEYAFTMANTYYYFLYKAKDPNAPLAITFFKDFNVASTGIYAVRKNAKHPAAATLFALWMGTPEAEAIWQPTQYINQAWGESELDKKAAQLKEEGGANMIELIRTDKGLEFLHWLSTEEGRKYKEALGRAIRGE